MKHILGLDLGASKIAGGIVNDQGKIINKIVQPTSQQGPQEVIKQLIIIGQDLLKGEKIDLLGLGLGTPGPFDSERGVVFTPPNLTGWKEIDLVSPLRRAFSCPIFADNDANAAALGEFVFGAGQGVDNMIYFTISTGIGGGIIINRQLYHGRFAAGELGHMIIDPNGPLCGCGNYGCLEALASGKAIAREAGQAPPNSLIWQLTKDKQPQAEQVFAAAAQGDKFAQGVISKALTALGIGLVNIIHIFHPDRIVLGGGVMEQQEQILPFLRDFVAQKVLPGFKEDVDIRAAQLGEEVGVIGAAALILEKI